MSTEPVFNHTAHKALWTWVSKNLGKHKGEWPGWKKHKHALNLCFACDYADQYDRGPDDEGRRNCQCCPFGRPPGASRKCCNGLYNAYNEAELNGDRSTMYEIAKKIIKLPLRDDWEWEDAK